MIAVPARHSADPDSSRIHQALFQLSKAGILPKEAHPHVATIDKMQGVEYELVISDFVVTDGSSRRSLGFNRCEHRCNVAFTRAIAASVALLPLKLMEGAITLKDDDVSSINSTGKDPFLIEYVKFMSKNASVYTVAPKGKLISSLLPLILGTN